MSDVKGLSADSPFIELLGDLPAASLLSYVHGSWAAYATSYKNATPPLHKRTEPQLTKALAAYLRQQQDAGNQPIPGHFFAELSDYILDEDGLPVCIGRTDIEWRLYGYPRFVIEFKVLDGTAARRQRYLFDGVLRFVDGRYASSARVSSMFAFMLCDPSNDVTALKAELRKSGPLRCVGVRDPSQLFSIASFDSIHDRASPHLTPFQLAHVFVSLSE